MKMSMTGQMRMEQRMKLAPRMIQSMEILQLPLLALQERIDQELNSNPVLELKEPAAEPESPTSEEANDDEVSQRDLVVGQDNNKAKDFERLESFGPDFDDYMSRASFRPSYQSDEPDKKLEALQNTAAPGISLNEYLMEQWRMVEAEDEVKKAGTVIIDYIDEKGYLTAQLEQFYNKDKNDFTMEHLRKAFDLVQKLEPAGVGARDLKECLLIQMRQSPDDMSFEMRLISEYMDELLSNHLPEIARKMNCNLERINKAISRISKLDTSPGLQIGKSPNHPITADVIVEPSEEGKGYSVRLADEWVPSLRISDYYFKMSKDRALDDKTKEFLRNNIRSAQWIIDAIEQRNSTLLKVAKSVVMRQTEFFDKGQLYLRPLPMAKVAEDVGVHIATISRAVAGKYIQCPQGILPLRGFFSGGMENADGQSQSWDAIRAQLQQIVDSEDKSKPLGDDEIRKKLEETGVKDIARRTVAKYRKLLNIPAARFRKKY